MKLFSGYRDTYGCFTVFTCLRNHLIFITFARIAEYNVMKKLLNILLFLSFSVLANAQLNCTFTHYSQENGLSENSVMDMVQDHDGMIWFATWDGINRFDGYDFKVYKACSMLYTK